MKVKSLGSNKTELELTDLRILVSYQTPVAAIRYNGTGALRTSEFHSVTTSKHINQWLKDNGYNPNEVPKMDQEYFNHLLE
jgi:hypothetical protein